MPRSKRNSGEPVRCDDLGDAGAEERAGVSTSGSEEPARTDPGGSDGPPVTRPGNPEKV